MTVVSLLQAMHRMPWRHVASKAIHLSGGRPRRGWRNTMLAAEDGGFENIRLSDLERLYKEHLLVGEKYTKLYELNAETASALRESFGNFSVRDNDYSDLYPLPLPEGQLAEATGGLQLMEVIRNDDGLGVVFCSRLTVTKKEDFIVNDWVDDSANCREISSQFTEIYGLRVERTQLFHVVWLSSDRDILDIRVDYPDGMHEDIAHRIHSTLRQTFEELIGYSVPSTPLDLKPAIGSIYSSPEEGHVVELSFVTVTDSVKNEKMRQARGGCHCLRQELFHRAGVDALRQLSDDEQAPDPIEPFRISVQWPIPAEENIYISPELTLATTTRGSGAGRITGVSVRNCLETAQYLYIRDKLLSHLQL